MNSRRSFFKRLAAVVAVVALAPEIAFSKRLELPKLDLQKFISELYDLARSRRGQAETIDILCDEQTAGDIRRCYANTLSPEELGKVFASTPHDRHFYADIDFRKFRPTSIGIYEMLRQNR